MPKSILIVDDNDQIRRVVRGFLEGKSGLKVCGEAVDGYEAIEKAQVLKPDLIVLDLSMPRMNGFETARILKNLLPQTPIILFTLHETSLVRWDALSAGIDLVVAKDSGLSFLADSVQVLLQKRSPLAPAIS